MSILKSASRMIALTVVLGGAFVATSGAQAADAAKGGTLAKRWCAACHVVAPDQRAGNPAV
ncbi:MAG: cytochrome C, partial [Pseudolabrys sp.]